jgi:hypothetical protein
MIKEWNWLASEDKERSGLGAFVICTNIFDLDTAVTNKHQLGMV